MTSVVSGSRRSISAIQGGVIGQGPPNAASVAAALIAAIGRRRGAAGQRPPAAAHAVDRQTSGAGRAPAKKPAARGAESSGRALGGPVGTDCH